MKRWTGFSLGEMDALEVTLLWYFLFRYGAGYFWDRNPRGSIPSDLDQRRKIWNQGMGHLGELGMNEAIYG